MSSTLPKPITNIVWGLFSGRCAMCNLVLSKTSLAGDSATIGKIAHIVGEKDGAARFDEKVPLTQRNSPNNLMLLCGTHHDMVDNYESEYSTPQLQDIRSQFIEKISTIFQQELLQVDYAELKTTISYLIGNSVDKEEGNLIIITPTEKIKKNELSVSIEHLLKMGLIQENQLENYLNKNLDTSFASRLRNIIVNKYNELREGGLTSDEIFYEMLDFASGKSSEFSARAAGLVIVSYYFNMCDIFEK